MNYNDALTFIHSVSNFFCKPGLERIEKLCNALDNPQNDLNFIHVAGTNGKGSFCALLSNVLKSAGYKVGRYTSPYILRFNERIAINDEPISDAALAEITQKVKLICQEMDDKPTEFELITAIGFEYFKRENCDIILLECGLGGRLDATNIIPPPLLSVITGIDFDHQNFLGDTIEKIASEKAGIIKSGVPCLFGGDNQAAKKVIEKEADEKNAPLYLINHNNIEILSADLNGTKFNFENNKNVFIPLLGLFQPQNAANVLKSIEILNSKGFNITKENIQSGFAATRWPARFEILCDNPIIIFDGSHNPQGVAAATKSIKQYFGNKKINVLSGVMADKDYDFIAKTITSVSDKVYCITAPNPRALPAEDYAKVINTVGGNATAYTSLQVALNEAIKESTTRNTPLVILGSLYTYSEIYTLIKRK